MTNIYNKYHVHDMYNIYMYLASGLFLAYDDITSCEFFVIELSL